RVVAELSHFDPPAVLGDLLEIVLQYAPTVEVDHGAIGRSRSVERDLLAGAFGRLLDLLLVRAGDDERRAGDLEALHRLARLGATALEGGNRHLAEVALGREAVAQEAVTRLAGDLGHQSPNPGEEDERRAVRVRPRV